MLYFAENGFDVYVFEGPGSIFTFGVKGGYENAKKVIESVKIFSHALQSL